MSFLKRCPSCGKHFEVRHTAETLDDSQAGTITKTSATRARYSGFGVMDPYTNVTVETTEVPVEHDTYEEAYTCKHCGYSWTEKKKVTRRLGSGTATTD
jgi:predicted RNA-binding Zn-ribbon protein involved in translation (DUF1610 family)